MEIAMMKQQPPNSIVIPYMAGPLVLLAAFLCFVAVSERKSGTPVPLSSASAATDGSNVHPAAREISAAPHTNAGPVDSFIDFTLVLPVD